MIAIIGVLIALLLPAVQSARESARLTQCKSRVRQLALAMHNYEESFDTLPAGCITTNNLSWNVLVLPFIEEQAIYDLFHEHQAFAEGTFNGGTDNEGEHQGNWLALNRIEMFFCPTALRVYATHPSSTPINPTRQTFTSHYYGVAGPVGVIPGTNSEYPHEVNGPWGGFPETGVLGRNSGVAFGQILDGTSHTLLLGELALLDLFADGETGGGGDGANWVRGIAFGTSNPNGMSSCKGVLNAINSPPSSLFNVMSFGSLHAGSGALFARVDGSVTFVVDSIDLVLYKSLASRNQQEALSE